MSNIVAPAAYANAQRSYYLAATGGTALKPTLKEPTLVSTITLQSGGLEGTLTEPASIFVPGPDHALAAYSGAIKLVPGGNVDAPNGAAGVVIRAGEGTNPGEACTIMEVGTDGESPNQLYIAGSQGLSEVYDELYNQPVDLRTITLSATNPLAAPDPANTGEIFRCEQAGVAAAAVGAIGTNFEVPKTGWYALQIEVKLGNAPAPAAPSINVPITVAAGGVNLGENLSFAFAQGVVVEPYGLMEITSNEMCVSEILTQNAIVVRTYTSMHYFEVDTEYTFTLRVSSATWNIGAAGQLKAELIAMC